MTGEFEEFLMKQLRRKRRLGEMKEFFKPLAELYDKDARLITLDYVSLELSSQTILPKIEGKTISIPPFDFRQTMNPEDSLNVTKSVPTQRHSSSVPNESVISYGNKDQSKSYLGSTEVPPAVQKAEDAQLKALIDPNLGQLFLESEGDIPYQEFVKTTFAGTHNIDMHTICLIVDQLHAAYGFAGEWIEFENEFSLWNEMCEQHNPIQSALDDQRLKVEKELGDLCYYAYMLHNLTTSGTVSLHTLTPPEDPARVVEEVLDLVKKKIFYKHDVDLSGIGIRLIGALMVIAEDLGQYLEYFILQNKTKLQKRYPSGKFSSTDAAEKKDKREF